MQSEVKNLGNTSIVDLKESSKDVEIFGNEETWLLISKASSKSQGWMKSTKAMEIEGQGCLVQTCTEFRTNGLTQVTACSDAITFVPGVRIDTFVDEQYNIIERKLVPIWPVDLPKTEIPHRAPSELEVKLKHLENNNNHVKAQNYKSKD